VCFFFSGVCLLAKSRANVDESWNQLVLEVRKSVNPTGEKKKQKQDLKALLKSKCKIT